MHVTSISAAEPGQKVCVTGVVRAAGEVLRSPLMGRECVYWDVRRGLRHEPERRGAVAFWVDDGSGRILVRTDALSVDVAAQRARETIRAADADTKAVGARLRRIKRQRKEAEGDTAKQLQVEHARLAKLVTFIHVVRAHARGKVHLGGKTFAEQTAWIEANAPQANAEAEATVAIAVDRFEVVIAPGDHVSAEGRVAAEPAPAGASASYRESPRCLALRPDGATRVRVSGSRGHRTKPEPLVQPQTPPPDRFLLVFVVVVAVITLLAWLHSS